MAEQLQPAAVAASTEPETTVTTTAPAVATPAPAPQVDLVPGDDPEDDDDADADSALGSDALSSTASVTANILEYRTIHGRTSHSDRHPTEYFTPNDERQMESLLVGGWPKNPKLAEVGNFVKLTMENDIEGYTLLLWHNVLNWPKDEYQIFLMGMRQALRNREMHAYMKVRYVYGRKPETA